MAEYTFQEVMKERKRMCDSDLGCANCPIFNGISCDLLIRSHPAEAERIIMDWAAKHPEPKYPTWMEWMRKMFPKTSTPRCPVFIEDTDKCMGDCCSDCQNTPIPPDAASKLGIDPEKFWKKETDGGGKNE